MLFLSHRKSSLDNQEGMERQNAAEHSCRGEILSEAKKNPRYYVGMAHTNYDYGR